MVNDVVAESVFPASLLKSRGLVVELSCWPTSHYSKLVSKPLATSVALLIAAAAEEEEEEEEVVDCDGFDADRRFLSSNRNAVDRMCSSPRTSRRMVSHKMDNRNVP